MASSKIFIIPFPCHYYLLNPIFVSNWKIFFKRLSSSVCSFIALSLLKSYLSSPASVNLTVNFRCQITLFDFAQINDCILEQKFIVIFQCSQRPRHCLFSLPSPIRIHSKKYWTSFMVSNILSLPLPNPVNS